MRKGHLLVAIWAVLICGGIARAQSEKRDSIVAVAQAGLAAHPEKMADGANALDAGAEKRALLIFLKSVEKQIVSAADAMPADKYGFAPEDGPTGEASGGHQSHPGGGCAGRGASTRCGGRGWPRIGEDQSGDT